MQVFFFSFVLAAISENQIQGYKIFDLLKYYYRIIAPDLHLGPLPMMWTVLLTLMVDPLEERRSSVESFVQSQWVGRLVESPEGLETKVGLRADLVGAPRICSLVWLVIWRVRLFWNRALIRCLAGIDYEMLELVSDDLVMGSEFCLWNPTVELHVLLNSGVEAALMCLDLLRLPNCTRTPHVGSSIDVVKIDSGRTKT
ncbi:hypothetical protein M9H77_17294 [Catharanthus roseus]|uniref:Uncharacterized protein n=1 Tax=Catharanthus roseus TaxID=4058 RepID=A0ACC0B459_CATRO|nr:hypothetical protein M9H77_17294 [Catharanthus roseus]